MKHIRDQVEAAGRACEGALVCEAMAFAAGDFLVSAYFAEMAEKLSAEAFEAAARIASGDEWA